MVPPPARPWNPLSAEQQQINDEAISQLFQTSPPFRNGFGSSNPQIVRPQPTQWNPLSAEQLQINNEAISQLFQVDLEDAVQFAEKQLRLDDLEEMHSPIKQREISGPNRPQIFPELPVDENSSMGPFKQRMKQQYKRMSPPCSPLAQLPVNENSSMEPFKQRMKQQYKRMKLTHEELHERRQRHEMESSPENVSCLFMFLYCSL
jgi:hypothetical protein